MRLIVEYSDSVHGVDGPQRSHRAAFTLIELVMVLATVAVVVAIAAPRWGRSMARWQAEMGARRLAADLAWAQTRARITSSSLTVHLDLASGQYSLSVPDPDHPHEQYAVNLAASPYHCTLVSASAADSNGNLVFDGFGSLAGGGTIVVQSGEFQRTVQISANSGAISLQ